MLPEQQEPAAVIATLGLQPQIITRGLDRILEQDDEVVTVHVLHTATYRAHPQWPTMEAFRDYVKSHYAGLSWEWIGIAGDDGHVLRDIRSPEDAEIAFRVIYNATRQLKQGGFRLHGLIAGGRKSIIVYSMVSAQLLFDVEDRLWHLFSRIEDKVPHVSSEMAHLVEIPVLHLAGLMPMVRELILAGDDPTRAIRLYREHEDVEKKVRLERFYSSLEEVDQEILRLAFMGYDNRQIGRTVGYSEANVNTRISKVANRFFNSNAFDGRLHPRPKHLRRPLLIYLRPLLSELTRPQE